MVGVEMEPRSHLLEAASLLAGVASCVASNWSQICGWARVILSPHRSKGPGLQVCVTELSQLKQCFLNEAWLFLDTDSEGVEQRHL